MSNIEKAIENISLERIKLSNLIIRADSTATIAVLESRLLVLDKQMDILIRKITEDE